MSDTLPLPELTATGVHEVQLLTRLPVLADAHHAEFVASGRPEFVPESLRRRLSVAYTLGCSLVDDERARLGLAQGDRLSNDDYRDVRSRHAHPVESICRVLRPLIPAQAPPDCLDLGTIALKHPRDISRGALRDFARKLGYAPYWVVHKGAGEEVKIVYHELVAADLLAPRVKADPPENTITLQEAALRLRLSHLGTRIALAQLGLSPVLYAGGARKRAVQNYYRAEDIEAVRSAMGITDETEPSR